jgi:hypothetical protein
LGLGRAIFWPYSAVELSYGIDHHLTQDMRYCGKDLIFPCTLI